jgi:hypothetical protein
MQPDSTGARLRGDNWSNETDVPAKTNDASGRHLLGECLADKAEGGHILDDALAADATNGHLLGEALADDAADTKS